MSKTSIEWTDWNWNPVQGCTRISSGCDNCYAMTMAHRFSKPGLWGAGLTRLSRLDDRPDWSGVIRLVPERLDEPTRWRVPRRVFVCSSSDLFHPKVPLTYIAAVWGAMVVGAGHTFQVLTKRPARAVEFFAWLKEQRRVDNPTTLRENLRNLAVAAAYEPLPNVWVGTSVENQATAHQRIPHLLKIPAAVRWLSVEPMLGPVTLNELGEVDWVVCGGESGTGSRMFDVQWARWLLEECRERRVPFFMKQLGAAPFDAVKPLDTEDAKGGNPDEWPADLRVREWPRGVTL